MLVLTGPCFDRLLETRLLCSNDSREYSSHSHRVQTLYLTVNGLKRSNEMQFIIALC